MSEWFGLAGYVLLVVALVRLYGRLARRRYLRLRSLHTPFYFAVDRWLTPAEADNLKRQYLAVRHESPRVLP